MKRLEMAQVLVVEDELDLQRVLVYNIELAGHDVMATAKVGEALRIVREHRPDVVVLDLMLPDGSGIDVCRAIKEDATSRDTSVIVVTARSDEIDRVVAFELGADDYVTKPFSMRELVLRIRAVLRRGRVEPEPAATIEFDKLRIDRGAHRVWVDGDEVELTALEFKLLLTLYERRSRVQTRTALLESVWGSDAGVSVRTVDAHVKRLRFKIGAARDYIETVRGVGYRFADERERPVEVNGQ
jgi:two-component system phosphate regulon response regulator PhoB